MTDDALDAGAPFPRPCRIIRVVRTAEGFAVVGELYGEGDSPPATWNVRSFPISRARSEAEAEAEANAASFMFGRHSAPWFTGESYVIDSRGRVTHIIVAEPPSSP